MPLRLLLALFAGLGLAVCFEPLGWWWLLPVVVAAFTLSTRGVGVWRGAVLGLVFGAAFWFTLIWWMRAVGYDALVALSCFMTLYSVLQGSVMSLVHRVPGWPLWSATTWLAVEGLRTVWPFGGFPWGRLAFAVVDTPVSPGLGWVGAGGMTFLLALVGCALAWAVTRARRTPVLGLVAVAATVLLTLLPSVHPWEPGGDGRQITVASIQGNVPGSGDDLVSVHREVTANHVNVTRELARDVAAGRTPEPRFVVWPENSTAVDPFLDPGVHEGIESASQAIDVPILVGAIVDAPDPDEILNQGIVWNPGSGGGDRYTKRHPVPFGEYIPYREQLQPDRNFGHLALVHFDMMSGTRMRPLNVAGVPVADAICFDVAYDDGLRAQLDSGAELVVVQTSNAMFIHTHQIEQQWEISRLRAIETGRYVVVAATNGVSGIIAPDGSVVTKAAPRTQAALVANVTLYSDLTPAVRFGTWWLWAAWVSTTLACLAGLVRYRRRATGGVEPTGQGTADRTVLDTPSDTGPDTDSGETVPVGTRLR